jgi:predicted helicase
MITLATFDEFITSIRTEFGEQGAGKPFEVFCKWFLENDPEWSKTVDKVWLWDDYPNYRGGPLQRGRPNVLQLQGLPTK